MKILICFGTRPEAIKMGALTQLLKQQQKFVVKVCVTAQHREMLDQVLDFFEIKPDYDLNIMKDNQTLNELSGRIFFKIDEVYTDFMPDLVLVHGDTTTSSICAWAAFNRNIKVGHVEAGLRTHNKQSPFPEEMNRVITGKIADFHFAPTETSKENLLRDGISDENIIVTGNTVIDSLYWAIEKIELGYKNDMMNKILSKVNFDKKIILVTAHRRENQGEGFHNICNALLDIARNNDVEIVFPVHLNPNVQKIVNSHLSNIPNIHLISPLDYPSFVWLMKKSYLILTDSGGIQEEAPSLGVAVLVMRDTTERPEAVKAGTVKLVGANTDTIIQTTNELLSEEGKHKKMTMTHNPYGDGHANIKILNFLLENNDT